MMFILVVRNSNLLFAIFVMIRLYSVHLYSAILRDCFSLRYT